MRIRISLFPNSHKGKWLKLAKYDGDEEPAPTIKKEKTDECIDAIRLCETDINNQINAEELEKRRQENAIDIASNRVKSYIAYLMKNGKAKNYRGSEVDSNNLWNTYPVDITKVDIRLSSLMEFLKENNYCMYHGDSEVIDFKGITDRETYYSFYVKNFWDIVHNGVDKFTDSIKKCGNYYNRLENSNLKVLSPDGNFYSSPYRNSEIDIREFKSEEDYLADRCIYMDFSIRKKVGD